MHATFLTLLLQVVQPLSKKALNVQDDSRSKGIQGNTSKSEIKCVCLTVFLPGLKGGKVLIWEKGTFVRGLSF